MNVRVLTVCGSIQPLSTNRAAIDVAHSYMRSRREVELDDYADLVRIPPLVGLSAMKRGARVLIAER